MNTLGLRNWLLLMENTRQYELHTWTISSRSEKVGERKKEREIKKMEKEEESKV